MAKEDVVDLIETTMERHTVKDSVTCARDTHMFVMVSGTEAECTKCHIGFVLGPGVTLNEGHLYLSGELMV